MTTDNVSEEQIIEGEPSQDEAAAASRPTPGRLLAAQREALGMTVHQIAETLNLTRHFIRSLEEDRYDKLPDEVFVRGYIRSYGKLVNLDPAQLLELYEEFTTKKQVRKEEAIKRHARRRRDKNQPWILVSGIAFVAVAATLWFLGSRNNDNEVADLPALDDMPVFDAPREPQRAAADAGSTFSSPVSSPDSGNPAPVAVRPEPAAGLAAAAPALNSAEDGVSADLQYGVEAEAEASDAQVTAEPADTPAPFTGTAVMLQWRGEDRLELQFASDSWVEVEHRGGTEAHRDLRLAGELLIVEGTAPFTILLGSARGVAVRLNGRTMDISANIRSDDTARLSLGM